MPFVKVGEENSGATELWRTDEVTPLTPHPNDPALTRS
jgi:hypothetical protein